MPRARTIATVLGVVTAATAGALAVQEARKRSLATTGGPVEATSRGARNAAMAGVGAKAGGAYALHRARRAFASAERQVELDQAFELKTAESITEALGNMKGAMMKLGQMASYLDQGMPPQVRAALAELQSNAPPMSAALAAEVIVRELGRPPEEVFATWDPQPIAAASIGQVHRAMTHDGRAVAVKVQYPGVGDAIRADLDNAGLLFGAMGMLFPGLEPEPLVAELRERLVEELDYRLEADNQRLFAEHYRDHPFIHVPEVVAELSTGEVLTTELAEGVRFEVLEAWSQEERDLAAETIFRFVFGSLYRLHAFNGDPHPGNYLFRPGGQVTFLDFGLVKRFQPEEIAVLESMIQAMVLDHDIPRYRSIIERIGMLQADLPFTDAEVEEYFGHFYDFVLRDEVATITPEYASETVRRFFDAGGPYGPIMKAANVPPAFVIIQRINLGLYAIFGQLRATANWRRISEELWPIVGGPPTTDLGRRDAAWAAFAPLMATGPVEVIGLDGDDTLWHSEQLFLDTQARFVDLLAPYVDVDAAALGTRLLEVERRNMATFGYGVKAFTLSLIETAIEATGGAVPASAIQQVLDLGKVLLDHPVQLLEGVLDAVDTLSDRYRLLLVTKGDLLHQESKVARSGLADQLWGVEIVSEKDEASYRRVLLRNAVDPAGFVMVGNSVRSDVLPVLELGGRAVHVPYHVTWELEHAEADPERHDFPVLASLGDLPACIAALDAAGGR